MGRTAGLDCYGEEEIFFPHRDLNPVRFGPYLAAIPTTLSRLGTRQMSRELYSSNETTVYWVNRELSLGLIRSSVITQGPKQQR